MRKVTKDTVRRYDFAKKPNRPGFLFPFVRHVICKPVLKRRGFKLTKINMENVEAPYLFLSTHGSMVDLHVMMTVTAPYRTNNVMTLEGFRDYTNPLMRHLGVLGTRKFITDVHLVKNIKYCVDKLGTVMAMYPEARYSLEGCDSFLPDSLGKMVKVLKVPVVVMRLHGNFINCPHWNKIFKKNPIEGEMIQVVTAEEVKTLSVEEINRRIREAFQKDDFKWQLENKVKIDHPKRAEGLHSLLYKCASCKTEGKMHSAGTKLWCEECGKRWEMTEYGQLKAQEGETIFSHIPDWTNWERACIREEVENGTYYFEDTVRVETLPSWTRFYKQGAGKFIQTLTETRLECNYYGEPFTLVRTAQNLDSMHIEYDYHGHGDCIDISMAEDSFWCYTTKRDVITKIAFATEEIHKYAVKKQQEEKKLIS